MTITTIVDPSQDSGGAEGICVSSADTLLAHVSLHLEIPGEAADGPRAMVCPVGDGVPECVDQDIHSESLLWAPGAAGMLTGP